MNVLIIEDERQAASRMQKLLTALMPEAKLLGPLDSIAATVKWLLTNEEPALIFSDIQLADGQSFEIFHQVNISAPIIFTTAYDQYAIKAFKLNSVDYLLKPIDPEELEEAINKFRNQTIVPSVDLSWLQTMLHSTKKQYKSRFIVKFGEKIQSISSAQIALFYSAAKTTFLQTHEGRTYIIDYALDQLDTMLDPDQYFRLNRKYIAELSAIAEIHTYSSSRLKIKLHNCSDNDILISREKVGHFKNWLDDGKIG